MKVRAIIVGIENHPNYSDLNLSGPRDDAIAFAELLRAQGVDPDAITFLANTRPPRGGSGPAEAPRQEIPAWLEDKRLDPTNDEIHRTLTSLLGESGSLLILYWSGHGIGTAGGDHKLVAQDATQSVLRVTNRTALQKFLCGSQIKYKQEYLIFDACQTQLTFSEETSPVSDINFPGSGPVTNPKRQIILNAADLGEEAWIDPKIRRSLYSVRLFRLLEAKEEPKKWDLPSLVKQIEGELAQEHASDPLAQMPRFEARSGDEELAKFRGTDHPRFIAQDDYDHLCRQLTGEDALLVEALRIRGNVVSTPAPANQTWMTLLYDVGDVRTSEAKAPSIVGYIRELARIAEGLAHDPVPSRRPAPGLALNLRHWADEFVAREGHQLADNAAPHCLSVVLMRSVNSRDKFQAATWYWTSALTENPLPGGLAPTEPSDLSGTLDKIRDHIFNIDKRENVALTNLEIEFLVPVESFCTEYEQFIGPDDDFGGRLPLCRNWSIVLRPIDYVTHPTRNQRLRAHLEGAGRTVKFIEASDSFDKVAQTYKDPCEVGGLCFGHAIKLGHGKGDILGAALSSGIPALAWFRTDDIDAVRARVLARSLEGHPHQLPARALEIRKRSFEGEDHPEWQTLALVVDRLGRVPDEVRERYNVRVL